MRRKLPALSAYATMSYDNLLNWRGDLVLMCDKGKISTETYDKHSEALEPYFQIIRCNQRLADLQKQLDELILRVGQPKRNQYEYSIADMRELVAEVEAKRDQLIAGLPIAQGNK